MSSETDGMSDNAHLKMYSRVGVVRACLCSGCLGIIYYVGFVRGACEHRFGDRGGGGGTGPLLTHDGCTLRACSRARARFDIITLHSRAPPQRRRQPFHLFAQNH